MLKMKLPSVLTELENTVLSYLLQEDSEENHTLRQQLSSCLLESREYNCYGIYTNFKLDDASRRCLRENFELGDITATLSGQLCGFILFVRDGKISFLEGFPLDGDAWPSTENIEKVSKFYSC
jgi:hypothetical protein